MNLRKVSMSLMLALAGILPAIAQINTDRVMTIGRNALYFEDYVLSIQYFNQVISAKPYLSDPYFFRGVAKLYLEDYAGAEADCSAAISLNPFVVDSYQVRGLARINQGKFQEAIDDYHTALRWDPENQSMRHNLILCYIRQDSLQDAMLAADSLLMMFPKYTPAMSMKAHLLFEEGDTLGSVSLLDKAIEIDRYDASLYQDRALIFLKQKDYQRGEQDLDQAIHLEPDRSSNYINRALARYNRNDLRGAMSDYDLAIELSPHDAMGHYNRGILRVEVGDDNRAIEDFDAVLEVEPDNMMAVFNRALLRDRTGDLSGAVQDYTTVLAEYPKFIQGYELRSEARYKLGDKAGAEADQMVVIRDRTERFNAASGYSSRKEEEETDEGKTRKASDKNVRNYRKLVVSDTDESATTFTSEYRGKVQNRNVDIQYLPYYQLTFFDNSKPSEVDRNVHFSAVLDLLNSRGILPFRLQMTSHDISLTEKQIQILFEDVDRQTIRISENPDIPAYSFARAMDYYMLQDFDNAERDLSAAIVSGEGLWCAYFCRAVVRLRMMQMRKAEKQMSLQSGMNDKTDNGSGIEYQLMLNDLSKVIDMEPDFAYAYYNRACIEADMTDYPAALADFEMALELTDNKLADAWFNRGITLIFLGRIDEGLENLSRAGEMGIFQSYNIMKRFQAQ